MTKAVLVTGGAGYIGAHACKALAKAGYLPVVYDDLSLGHAAHIKWGPHVHGDIRDRAAIEAALTSHKAEAVIHFAALSAVGESMAEPARYYDTNVRGTMALLDAMVATGTPHLVFSSTAAVYGEPDKLPISEDAALLPVNPYGRTKLICERMAADYAVHGVKAVALRYFNASGADPETEIGEKRAAETHLIPRAMMALQGYIHDFQVFGSDFPTPDGTAIRDYIHVTDLAEGHVLALRHLENGGAPGAFNLGVGHGYSVLEILKAVAAASGREIPAPKGARRPGDPNILVADPSRARATLGFAPLHSDLKTIAETAWKWHRIAHPARNDPAPQG
ncbi:MAG: UDP-glucose 4-epimerase GalE [Micropepsaceae bacterium]